MSGLASFLLAMKRGVPLVPLHSIASLRNDDLILAVQLELHKDKVRGDRRQLLQ